MGVFVSQKNKSIKVLKNKIKLKKRPNCFKVFEDLDGKQKIKNTQKSGKIKKKIILPIDFAKNNVLGSNNSYNIR